MIKLIKDDLWASIFLLWCAVSAIAGRYVSADAYMFWFGEGVAISIALAHLLIIFLVVAAPFLGAKAEGRRRWFRLAFFASSLFLLELGWRFGITQTPWTIGKEIGLVSNLISPVALILGSIVLIFDWRSVHQLARKD